MREVKTKVNSSLTLECESWAVPPPTIRWYKDGQVSAYLTCPAFSCLPLSSPPLSPYALPCPICLPCLNFLCPVLLCPPLLFLPGSPLSNAVLG